MAMSVNNDGEWGERMLVVIQLNKQTEQPAIRNSIQLLCEQRLARFQQPADIVFSDTLPRTEAGKLQRRQVRDQYRQIKIPVNKQQETL